MTSTGQRRAQVPWWKGAVLGVVVGVLIALLTRDMAFLPTMGVAVLVGLGAGLVVIVFRRVRARWGAR